jgi:hypothetical protein
MAPINRPDDAGDLLSKLNIEVGKMLNEFGDLKGLLGNLAQSFQQATQGKGGSLATGGLGLLAVKLGYIAVLQGAIEKAGKSQNFNIETAINDLWIALDAVKKLAAAGTQPGSASIDVETMKLKRMIQKRSQMFDMLRGIMEKYDATAKGVIQSMGR